MSVILDNVVDVDDNTRIKLEQIVDLKEDGMLSKGQPSNVDVDDNTRIKLEQLGIY